MDDLDVVTRRVVARLERIADHLPPVQVRYDHPLRERAAQPVGPQAGGRWRELALCESRPDLDWVVAPGAAELAVCQVCPVRIPCHLAAERTPGMVGMWGGVVWREELAARWTGRKGKR